MVGDRTDAHHPLDLFIAFRSVGMRSRQRYLTTILERHDWVIDRPADVETRTFWSTVFGARLISESGFGGRSSDIDLAGVLTIRARSADR